MRIIKRRKGKRDYFYLQHSFRKNRKVITKEKYIGIKIPKNIEKIKQDLGILALTPGNFLQYLRSIE